jgi:hypothetical protein
MTLSRTPWAAWLALGLLTLAVLGVAGGAGGQAESPPEDAQRLSYSIAAGSPLALHGAHPGDIMGIGDLPLIPCTNLGLVCTDLVGGAQDDLSGLSFGYDFQPEMTPWLLISPAPGSAGMPGSAVRAESLCQPAESQADVFESPLDKTNVQYLDGDGQPCAANAGYSLYLQELPASDNLDALDGDPSFSVDLDRDGLPENPIYLTLAPGSPSLAYLGISAADVLMVTGYTAPSLWASGQADFGLKSGDAIDALCIQENGNGRYDSEDQVLLSLAPASPSLAALGVTPGDLLRLQPHLSRLYGPVLGLAAADDLDAAFCGRQVAFYDLLLPLIWK